jgi:hypothetical protein
MLMTPGLRKFALTTHVTSSVGWFGAVATFFSLAVAGVTSSNPQTVRAAYVAMELLTWGVIVPFSLASLLTGILQSLGTTWGLFRYHWIVAKLALTALATAILLVHTQPIGRVAALASQRLLSNADLYQLRTQLVADAGAAMVALLVATTLSVYKPWGLTAYGRRRDIAALSGKPHDARPSNGTWRALWLLGLVVAVGLFVILHLAGGGFHNH